MTDFLEPTPSPDRGLRAISTRWPLISDPLQFILRYAPAIQGYLTVLLPNAHDAEEVTQDFLARVVQQGFAEPGKLRGRFRDYLAAAVRNAAVDHLRRKRLPTAGGDALEAVVAPATESAAEEEWRQRWRASVLDAAWEMLEKQERASPRSLCYTALRVATEHPDADSTVQAAHVSQRAGRPVRPDAFRKQLSRARQLFGQLIAAEVARTLEAPTPSEVAEELIELGLYERVRPYLSPE